MRADDAARREYATSRAEFGVGKIENDARSHARSYAGILPAARAQGFGPASGGRPELVFRFPISVPNPRSVARIKTPALDCLFRGPFCGVFDSGLRQSENGKPAPGRFRPNRATFFERKGS